MNNCSNYTRDSTTHLWAKLKSSHSHSLSLVITTLFTLTTNYGVEFYKSTNVDLLRTYETNIKSIIEATKGINSQTLRVIYNYRTWKFIIQNNLKTELLSNLSSQTHYNSVNNSVNNLVNGVNVTEKSLEKVLDEMIENGPVRRDGMEYTMLINLLYIKSIQIKELPNEEKSQELTIL